MTKMEALVADVDGTYIDTLGFIYQAHYQSTSELLAKGPLTKDIHIPFQDYADVLKDFLHISPRKRSEATLRKFFEDRPDLIAGMDFDVLYEMLLAGESQIAEKAIKPFPNLHPTLQKVGETGIKHAIWTSANRLQVVRSFGIALPEINLQELHKDTSRDGETKAAILTQAIAKTYEIPGFIIVTADDIKGKNKPDPEGFLTAMSGLGAEPATSGMLGDHAFDMQAAKTAGAAERIGITHGSHDEHVLKANGATVTIDSLEELPVLL
jgi:phosphoglycolate phosphatase-like HAD superfamily hydrolase